MNELFKEKTTCRLCNSADLKLVMHLEPTPIGDKYLPVEQQEQSRELIPLGLNLCGNCEHLQTITVVNPSAVFEHYLSRPAAVNQVFSDAFREYAETILSDINPGSNDLIFEIGSGDGTFLDFFKQRGFPVLGIDPAVNLAESATKNGIQTIPNFFNHEVAKDIRSEHGPASVIITNFTLASIDDLDDVVKGIKELLSPNGVLMFETQYRLDGFQKLLLETLNNEQNSIFSVKPLNTYFSRHGLELMNVQRVPSKGGSIRCTVKQREGNRTISSAVQEHIDMENRLDISHVDFFKPCISRIHDVREKMINILEDIKLKGKSVAGYGTSIGATNLTYQLGMGEAIEYFVDDDSYRQNLVSPGYNIPVLDPKVLLEKKPDYVLIMAPLYADQIINKNQAYIDQGGRFMEIWPTIRTR